MLPAAGPRDLAALRPDDLETPIARQQFPLGVVAGSLALTTVQTAMTQITTPAVWNWCRAHLGATVQSVRQRIGQALHPEQKQKTLRLESG